MLKWVFGGGRKNKGGKPPAYEDAKEIAANGDVEARRRLASVTQLQPEFLYYFASDESPEVRRAVADNEGTPIQADILLARDPDEFVKSDLCKKLGRLLPELAPDENRKLAEMVFEVVDILSNDSLPQVRAMISEQVRGLENVPPRIIQRLARDAEEIVASPVLQYSPLLTDKDLIDIVAMGCRGEALAALSRRKGLSDHVGAAVAETEDEIAMPALLDNRSADLSENTLGRIIDASDGKDAWHRSLVQRKDMNVSLLRRMARYVSVAALDRMVENNVLIDDKLENELRTAVTARLSENEAKADAAVAIDQEDEDRQRAETLHSKGELTPAVMTEAAQSQQREFLIHALALLSESKDADTRKLTTATDPKLAVSIAWRCKLGMGFAMAFQEKIMELPEKSRMTGDGGDKAYPMGEDDMAWALEVLGIQ